MHPLVEVLNNFEELWFEDDSYDSFLKKVNVPDSLKEQFLNHLMFSNATSHKRVYIQSKLNPKFMKICVKRALIYAISNSKGSTLPDHQNVCIEMNGICDKKCTHCYHDNNGQLMDDELFHSILDFADQHLVGATLIGGRTIIGQTSGTNTASIPRLDFFSDNQWI